MCLLRVVQTSDKPQIQSKDGAVDVREEATAGCERAVLVAERD